VCAPSAGCIAEDNWRSCNLLGGRRLMECDSRRPRSWLGSSPRICYLEVDTLQVMRTTTDLRRINLSSFFVAPEHPSNSATVMTNVPYLVSLQFVLRLAFLNARSADSASIHSQVVACSDWSIPGPSAAPQGRCVVQCGRVYRNAVGSGSRAGCYTKTEQHFGPRAAPSVGCPRVDLDCYYTTIWSCRRRN